IKSIEDKGLLPKGRQYVHLSNDIKTALQVGKRHHNKPIILEIDAKRALDEGVKFYLGNDKVWLGDNIPSKYIKVTS
ncbi:MAG: RNA 2'-phosphotransferase, partial [Clostridium septicum]|uniref:RNA 2'-phosphotransferase n=1 Tax=Clostridium septicum TaxID=1504 RepID=UPI002904F50E